MDSPILTLGALAVLVTCGWIIDVLAHRAPPTRMQRLLASQLERSADAIRGRSAP